MQQDEKIIELRNQIIKVSEKQVDKFGRIILQLNNLEESLSKIKVKLTEPEIKIKEFIILYVVMSDMLASIANTMRAENVISQNNSYKFLISTYFEFDQYSTKTIRLEKKLKDRVIKYNESEQLASKLKEFRKKYNNDNLKNIRNKITFHYDADTNLYVKHLTDQNFIDYQLITDLLNIFSDFTSIHNKMIKKNIIQNKLQNKKVNNTIYNK